MQLRVPHVTTDPGGTSCENIKKKRIFESLSCYFVTALAFYQDIFFMASLQSGESLVAIVRWELLYTLCRHGFSSVPNLVVRLE